MTNHIVRSPKIATCSTGVFLNILMVSLLLLCTQAQAVVNCRASTLYPPLSITPTISVTSYAGNDIPVGTTIYRNQVNVTPIVGVYCDASYSVATNLMVINEPLGAPVMMSGLSYGNGSGPVYPTNVSGVGILFFKDNIIISSSQPLVDKIVYYSAGDHGVYNYKFDLVLVKTGPIASGAVVSASSFPDVGLVIPPQTGYSGLPVYSLQAHFSGSAQFITATCTTPDVNVDMGTYDIISYFNKVGSVGPWIDASIVMNNCPTFQGYHGDHGTSQTTTGSSTSTGSIRNNNLFTVSLTPANSVSGNVIAIDQGDDSASGIGLQIGYTANDVTASPTSPQSLWTAGTTWDITAPTDGRSTIKIPLAARYYQNAQKVTAGDANAKVIFNIQYK
jgi:type 1 fimbria pilin